MYTEEEHWPPLPHFTQERGIITEEEFAGKQAHESSFNTSGPIQPSPTAPNLLPWTERVSQGSI
jgi:hypothetical protein